MDIFINEIEKTGKKTAQWHFANFTPSDSANKEIIFNEAFRIALYSYIARFFPNGFGMRTKEIANLPDGQLGRVLYCSGFQTNALIDRKEPTTGVEMTPNRTFEILVTQ